MRYTRYILPILFLMYALSLSGAVPPGYERAGHVESLRSDGLAVIHIDGPLPAVTCYLLVEDRIAGEISVLEILEQGSSGTRILARLVLNSGVSAALVHGGTDVVISRKIEKFKRELTGRTPLEEHKYLTEIISSRDARKMRLVSEGKCHMGSNQGDRDEVPLHTVYRDSFYMDVYEVSNNDYLRYVTMTNASRPASWQGKMNTDGSFRDGLFSSLPVLVSFHEAEAYAAWAGKRLPTEIEWEKAARGAMGPDTDIEPRFPWGSRYTSSMANCQEFWNSEENRKLAQSRYGVVSPGLLPVASLEEGASPFGMVNMAGNAPEWTCDWYKAYKGNRTVDRRYGNQYKTIRGGGWWSSVRMIRVTSREPGGKPNLYRDNSAGFRCVRDVNFLDRTEGP